MTDQLPKDSVPNIENKHRVLTAVEIPRDSEHLYLGPGHVSLVPQAIFQEDDFYIDQNNFKHLNIDVEKLLTNHIFKENSTWRHGKRFLNISFGSDEVTPRAALFHAIEQQIRQPINTSMLEKVATGGDQEQIKTLSDTVLFEFRSRYFNALAARKILDTIKEDDLQSAEPRKKL